MYVFLLFKKRSKKNIEAKHLNFQFKSYFCEKEMNYDIKKCEDNIIHFFLSHLYLNIFFFYNLPIFCSKVYCFESQ